MKKEFFESEIEIIYFDKQDVITDVITTSPSFELEDDDFLIWGLTGINVRK